MFATANPSVGGLDCRYTIAADAAASTGKYPRHPCNPRSDCKYWNPDGAWERSEKGDAADTAAATTLTTRPAGEHGKGIAEAQHKESIMFLAERPTNPWSLLQFLQAPAAHRV